VGTEAALAFASTRVQIRKDVKELEQFLELVKSIANVALVAASGSNSGDEEGGIDSLEATIDDLQARILRIASGEQQ
jgi:hypothetical protein